MILRLSRKAQPRTRAGVQAAQILLFFLGKKNKNKKNQRDKPHLNLSALSLAQVTPEKLMLKQESG